MVVSSLRGGAGPLEPVTAAKFLGCASLLQGAQCALVPTNMKPFFDDDVNECNAKIVRQMGLAIFNIGITIFCTVFKNYNLKVAATINSLMWVANCLSSLLNKESETVGPTVSGDISILAFNGMSVFYLFS